MDSDMAVVRRRGMQYRRITTASIPTDLTMQVDLPIKHIGWRETPGAAEAGRVNMQGIADRPLRLTGVGTMDDICTAARSIWLENLLTDATSVVEVWVW